MDTKEQVAEYLENNNFSIFNIDDLEVLKLLLPLMSQERDNDVNAASQRVSVENSYSARIHPALNELLLKIKQEQLLLKIKQEQLLLKIKQEHVTISIPKNTKGAITLIIN